MDERLRQLARAWQESGDPQAEAAWIAAAMRAGQLSRASLRVAAWCGDEVARDALGIPGLSVEAPRTGIRRFVSDLPSADVVVRRRLAHALFAHLKPELHPALAASAEELCRLEALSTEEQGGVEARQRARAVAAACYRQLGRRDPIADLDHLALSPEETRVVYVLYQVEQGVGGELDLRDALAAAGYRLARVQAGESEDESFDLRISATLLAQSANLPAPGERALRRAIGAALTPWVLLRPQEGEREVFHDPHASLFPCADMTSDVARVVVEAGGESRARVTLPAEVAREVVRTYLLARGWSERRGSLHPPGEDSLQLRVKTRPRVVLIEAGGVNNWTVTSSLPLRGLALLLLKHARAAAPS